MSQLRAFLFGDSSASCLASPLVNHKHNIGLEGLVYCTAVFVCWYVLLFAMQYNIGLGML